MSVYNDFRNAKAPVKETEFVREYDFVSDGVVYRVIITKKRAGRHSVIHCTDNRIEWEQLPVFPRISGRMNGDRVPVYKFDGGVNGNDKKVTLFVIKGNPNGICGLDDGIFRSAKKFDTDFINVMSYGRFKEL